MPTRNARRHGRALLAALALTVACARVAQGQVVYWADQGSSFGASIHRADLSGNNAETLLTTGGEGLVTPSAIAIDAMHAKLYWADMDADTIRRADLDGANAEDVLTAGDGIDVPFGIAVDAAAQKLYWSEGGATPDTLRRANLDGSGIETLVSGNGVGQIALDLMGAKVYWTDVSGSTGLYRADLDGTNVEHIVASASALLYTGLAVSPQMGKIYWAETGVGQIQRCNLDGSSFEVIADGAEVGTPVGVAFDETDGTLYWTDLSSSAVMRADPDGANASVVLDDTDGLGSPVSVAIDFTPLPAPAPAAPLRQLFLLTCSLGLVALVVLRRK